MAEQKSMEELVDTEVYVFVLQIAKQATKADALDRLSII